MGAHFHSPFVLQTDALDRGLGAVLSQVVQGEKHSMLYISWKLSIRDTKYSMTEMLCLGNKHSSSSDTAY